MICDQRYIKQFFCPILVDYVRDVRLPRSCELCERSQFALTAHHLIPRSMHHTVLKRAWHDKQRLTNIAWLCRGCHGFVHKIVSPEALEKDYWSIELLLRRTEIWQFAKTVGRLVN